MQYDPNKQGYNNYGNTNVNQYPPMNQSPHGGGNFYPPNNAPPPYHPQYPPPPVPVYQQNVVVVPMHAQFWTNLMATPMTANLRMYLVISGILYLIWGVLNIAFEIGVLVDSYRGYYVGFFGGGFLIAAGIQMLVASCRPNFIMIYMVRMLTVVMILCSLGLILSIINLASSDKCSDYSSYHFYCDSERATQIKSALVAFFVIASIHTVISLVVTSNTHRRTMTTPAH